MAIKEDILKQIKTDLSKEGIKLETCMIESELKPSHSGLLGNLNAFLPLNIDGNDLESAL